MSEGDVFLEIDGLTVEFHTDDGVVHAVQDVSLEVSRGEVSCIVGESGSGKTVTAMSVLGLLPMPPAKYMAGEIRWKGRNLLKASEEELRKVRGEEVAMIFQDPLSALNPVHRVGDQIVEAIRAHEGVAKDVAKGRAVDLLKLVGIPQADRRFDSYPHEFSGGMRQRVVIAMAISCNPDLLIADEPTTALDVTVQAQVLEVLTDIKEEIDSAILLITHDLGVVAGLADHVSVMYAGRIVERGSADDLFYRPAHPYTKGLLESLPRVEDPNAALRPIKGAPPSLVRVPPGCAFHPRCPRAELPQPCAEAVPAEVNVGAGHGSSCHFAEDVLKTSLKQSSTGGEG